MDESKVETNKKPGLVFKIKEKLKQYRRVLSVSRKPAMEDLVKSMKITSAGIIFIGAIGFIIFLMYFLIQSIGV